jgi:hypothetical protein
LKWERRGTDCHTSSIATIGNGELNPWFIANQPESNSLSATSSELVIGLEVDQCLPNPSFFRHYLVGC